MATTNSYNIKPGLRHPEFWPSVAEYLVYDDLLYLAMSIDEKRNRAYRRALREHVEGKVVVDVGAGPEALLSAMAIECGARHVYAIEYLEKPFRKARAKIRSRKLDDRVSLIHGDARHVQLPEKGDVCISGLVGSIGSLEGIVPILNEVRAKLLNPGATMIPQRSVTRVAAVTLPESLRSNGAFADLPAKYVDRIFEEVGFSFDLRLCIRNFPQEMVRTSTGVFEDLDFTRQSEVSYAPTEISLEMQKDGRIDGFLLWLDLFLADGVKIDILQDEYCLLPIYLDTFGDGLELKKGDRIVGTCTTRPSANGLNPDYKIEGSIHCNNGLAPFTVDSVHCPQVRGNSPLYRKLLREK